MLHLNQYNHRHMIMICTYASTESDNEETKDAFYEELEQIYYAMLSHCIKIVLVLIMKYKCIS